MSETTNVESLDGQCVLVTGGAGLIGGAFLRELVIRGVRARTVRHWRPVHDSDRLEIVDGDLRDLAVAREACRGVDAVVHAAGVSGGSGRVAEDPVPMFVDSLHVQANVIEAARAEGVSRLLYVSNSSVYTRSDAPQAEADAYSGPPENETGLVKLAGEAQCAISARSSEMRVAIIRAGNAYGPNDDFDLESSHVVPALVRKAVEGDGRIELWGDGTAIRDFIHSSDIARGGLHVLEHAASSEPEPVNVATGRPVSIAGLARMALRAAGHESGEVVCSGQSPPASRAKLLDVTRMQQLGFRPRLALEDGLRETVDWYRSFARVPA